MYLDIRCRPIGEWFKSFYSNEKHSIRNIRWALAADRVLIMIWATTYWLKRNLQVNLLHQSCNWSIWEQNQNHARWSRAWSSDGATGNKVHQKASDWWAHRLRLQLGDSATIETPEYQCTCSQLQTQVPRRRHEWRDSPKDLQSQKGAPSQSFNQIKNPAKSAR